jgi:uncharacterized protein YoaH (UPF0181 family)
MCPACIVTTAMLIASAVSTGGATAVVVNKIRAKGRARRVFKSQKEESWVKQRMSKSI